MAGLNSEIFYEVDLRNLIRGFYQTRINRTAVFYYSNQDWCYVTQMTLLARQNPWPSLPL